MNIMLVARDSASTLISLMAEDENLWVSVSANDLQESRVYWRCYQKYIDLVLIVEEATNFFENDFQEESLSTLKKIANNKEGKKIVYITTMKSNFELINKEKISNIQCFHVAENNWNREAIIYILNKTLGSKSLDQNHKSKILEEITKSLRDESRAIVFTGQEGSGITATASHMAYHASLFGIKTYIINLNFSHNVFENYFHHLGNAKGSKQDCDAFVNCFLIPEQFEELSQKVNGNLFVSTFNDANCLNSDKLQKISNKNYLENAINIFKKKAQLIIVDAPFDGQSTINAITPSVDVFALCVANNLYSLNSLTKMIKTLKPDSEFFEKSKLVLSKFHMKNTYGGKAFNGELACDILGQMNKELDVKFKSGGEISAIEDFIQDVENLNNPAIKNNELKKRYLETLHELL